MTKTSIRFKAKLLRPAMEPARPRADQSEKAGSWTFVTLPKNASAKLPAQSRAEVARSCGRRRRRACDARDRARGKGTGTRSTGRSEKSSRYRRSEREKLVVGHHAQCAPGLDPLDHLCQAGRDARASDQKCLLDARGREATRLLLRPLRVLQ